MSIQDRLSRLLFIVPYVAHRDGVPLKELAERLGVKTSQIVEDLDLVSMVGRPPLTPDNLIDVYIEDDVVYVELDQSLTRPPRLTHEEALALVLGARLVGDLGGLGAELDAVLEKIAAALTPVEQAAVKQLSQRVGVAQEPPTIGGPLQMLRLAIDAHAEVQLDYYSASSDEQKTYQLEPLGLVNHTGAIYLVARDCLADRQEKLFRLDRMGGVRSTGAHFVPPADFDMNRFRTHHLVQPSTSTQAVARFAPRLARVVSERFAASQVSRAKDGSVEVRLFFSSVSWLSRFLLPFGIDVEVLAPQEARNHLAQFCTAAAKAYAQKLVPPA
jgi:proteasome accessory factor C